MTFRKEDIQEQLEQLGYGNQWDKVKQKLSGRLQEVNAAGIQRVLEHNKRFPEKHKAAKSRWHQKRYQQTKDRVGKQKCHKCFTVLMSRDLIGQNRLHGHCKKCRKELLG